MKTILILTFLVVVNSRAEASKIDCGKVDQILTTISGPDQGILKNGQQRQVYTQADKDALLKQQLLQQVRQQIFQECD